MNGIIKGRIDFMKKQVLLKCRRWTEKLLCEVSFHYDIRI